MLYEVYCRGHKLRFKSAGGDAKSRKYFCSGCHKAKVYKLLKSQMHFEASNHTILDLTESLTAQRVF